MQEISITLHTEYLARAEADVDVKISGDGIKLELPPLALAAMTLRL